MAISANAILELRASGSDTNGGGFVTGASGTDWSQQDSPQYSVTDGVTAGTTTITSATANFGTDVVGNLIYVSGGSGSVSANRYEIKTRVGAQTITVDRSTGLTAGTGVTLKIGGALLTPATAIAIMMLSGMQCYAKSGTYSGTALSMPSISAGSAWTRIIGYTTTRGDLPGAGARPIFRITGSGFIFTGGSGAPGLGLENIDFDGNNVASTDGVSLNAYQYMHNCIVRRVTNFRGILMGGGGPCHVIGCEVTGVTGSSAAIQMGANAGRAIGNYVHDNTCPGITAGGNALLLSIERNIVTNNTGASSDGIALSSSSFVSIKHNTVYASGRDGIRLGETNIYNASIEIMDNILVNNGGYGINDVSAASPQLNPPLFDFNAFYNNTSGAVHNIGAGAHDVTLSGVPFTNAGSNDYSLNGTAGQGAACKAVAFPGALTLAGGGNTNLDIGALQSTAAAAGGLLTHPGMAGGCRA